MTPRTSHAALQSRRRPAPRAVRLLLVLCVLFSACEKAKQDMYDQPKYKPYARSPLFTDGTSARPLPPGSEPHSQGPFAGPSSGRLGEEAVQRDQDALAAQQNPYPLNLQLLQRGQERYAIYCMPCHSPAGDGDGLIVRRGFPNPPSYHIDRLRQASDRHFFDIISHGYGVMVSYADRVTPPDRWAIVAYIRALQLSQHAQVSQLPPAMQALLEAQAGPATGAAPASTSGEAGGARGAH